MPCKLHVMESSHAIRAQCSGSVSREDIEMLGIEASHVVKTQGHRKVLLDMTDGTLALTAQGLGILIDVYAECRMPTTVRTAIVLGTRNWPESFADILTTAKAYGYSVEMLRGEADVKDWLLGPT